MKFIGIMKDILVLLIIGSIMLLGMNITEAQKAETNEKNIKLYETQIEEFEKKVEYWRYVSEIQYDTYVYWRDSRNSYDKDSKEYKERDGHVWDAIERYNYALDRKDYYEDQIDENVKKIEELK